MTFGEDRAQAGLAPKNASTGVFTGLDSSPIWITNAAFHAFETFHVHAPKVVSLATSTDGNAGDYLCAALEPDSRKIRAFLFPWRVSPLYDVAAPEFRKNFTQLVFNMATLLSLSAVSGVELPADAATPPVYVAPNFEALQRALDWFDENYDFDEYPNGAWYSARLSELQTRSDNLAKTAAERRIIRLSVLIGRIVPDIDYVKRQQPLISGSSQYAFRKDRAEHAGKLR